MYTLNLKSYISILFLLTLCISDVYGLYGTGETYTIPFSEAGGLILIDAQIAGQKGKFIFDTGSTDILVHQAGTHPAKANETTTVFETVSGPIVGSEVVLPHLLVADYKLENLAAFSCDLSFLDSQVGFELLGILGISLFEGKLIHIDNINKVIELKEDRQLINSGLYHQVAFTHAQDLFLVPLKIGEKTYQFALDTGASASIFDKSVLTEQVDYFQPLHRETNFHSASDEILSKAVYELEKVVLANIAIKNLQMAVSDLSAIMSDMPDNFGGILSVHQLAATELIIDFQTNSVFFKF